MKMGSALALRTGAVIAATVALAVLLSVLLAGLKFERTLRDVTASRLSVVADEVRRRVEYGLTLGLDLAELVDVQNLIERAAEPEEILGAEVVDDRGTVLFASEQATVGKPSPTVWEDPGGPIAGGIRQKLDGDAMILGAGIRNSFGQTVGEVVIRSSLAGMRQRVALVERELTGGTLLMVGAAALVTLGAVFLVVHFGGRRLMARDILSSAVRSRLEHGVGQADDAMDEIERELGNAPVPATRATTT